MISGYASWMKSVVLNHSYSNGIEKSSISSQFRSGITLIQYSPMAAYQLYRSILVKGLMRHPLGPLTLEEGKITPRIGTIGSRFIPVKDFFPALPWEVIKIYETQAKCTRDRSQWIWDSVAKTFRRKGYSRILDTSLMTNPALVTSLLLGTLFWFFCMIHNINKGVEVLDPNLLKVFIETSYTGNHMPNIVNKFRLDLIVGKVVEVAQQEQSVELVFDPLQENVVKRQESVVKSKRAVVTAMVVYFILSVVHSAASHEYLFLS